MVELFAVGTFWFWCLVAAEIVLLLVFTEFENGIAASLSLGAFLAALQFCSDVNVLGWMWQHPITLASCAVAYLFLGTGWGIFKWRRYVKGKLSDYNEAFARFLRDNNLPPETDVLPMELRKKWKVQVEHTRHWEANEYVTIADTPLARRNKSRIMRWMSLWVFSVALYFGKDLVIDVFTAIYTRLATFLQRMADNIFATAKIKENLDVPEDEDDNPRNRR